MNYYIQGDAANADQIKTAFEQLGYDISWPEGCANPDVINIGVERNGAKYVVAETAAYIRDIIKTHPDYQELELPVEPLFKVGDSLQSGSYWAKIRRIDAENRRYICDFDNVIPFEEQELWSLVPNSKPHYDISNFKPFDRVLVRQDDSCTWGASFFGRYSGMFMCCSNVWFEQCIPFNDDTKHLLGTTDMCDEQYINW